MCVGWATWMPSSNPPSPTPFSLKDLLAIVLFPLARHGQTLIGKQDILHKIQKTHHTAGDLEQKKPLSH